MTTVDSRKNNITIDGAKLKISNWTVSIDGNGRKWARENEKEEKGKTMGRF